MKRKLWLLPAAVVVVAGLIAAGCTSGAGAGPSPLSNISIPGNILQQSGIWVTGEGKVKAVPDTVVLSLGIEVQAITVSEAQQKAQTSMDAVVKALKDKGVSDKDVQTQRFSINPVYRYIDKENRQEIIGYHISNQVTAKVRRVDDAGPVIDAVAKAGGDLTRINGISFTIDDPSVLQTQATEMALKDAKAKAKLIADTLTVKLGKVTYTQINNASTPYPISIQKFDGRAAGAPEVATPISPGELTIQASATVAWGIE